MVGADNLRLISPDLLHLVHTHHLHAIVTYFERLVVSDALPLVIFDQDVPVFFALKVDLFSSALVLETEFVEVAGTATGGASGFDAALGFVGGEPVKGWGGGVIDCTHNDRPVRIAVDKIDENLIAYARKRDETPAIAAPWLAGAEPAGASLVFLTFPVPVELNLYPPVFIGMDLLARGTSYHRTLQAADKWLWQGIPCAEDR